MRWASDGMTIVSVNSAGISDFKLQMLLDKFQPDFLCLQETWLAGGVRAPPVPGYPWYEQRRPTGIRGGIAVLVRVGINILLHRGN